MPAQGGEKLTEKTAIPDCYICDKPGHWYNACPDPNCPEHIPKRAYCKSHAHFLHKTDQEADEYRALYQAYKQAKKKNPGLTWHDHWAQYHELND